jgi:hypothetical protein
VNALVRSLLVKSPTLLKPGRGDSVLSALFAEAVREADPALGESLAVLYWRGGTVAVEAEALEGAEVLVVYGSDETVAALRARAPATTRVVAYHHRVGVGVVGRAALTRDGVRAVADDVARAAALFERRGCVCPQLVLAEEGGEVSPPDFARQLGAALERLDDALPAPVADLDEAGALRQFRTTAEIHAAAGALELHQGRSWTVTFESTPSGLGVGPSRAVRVRSVADLSGVAEELRPLRRHLQSVGYAGLDGRESEIGEALARAGASRLTSFARLPFPPPWWMHDGRGPLRELLRWTELERP